LSLQIEEIKTSFEGALSPLKNKVEDFGERIKGLEGQLSKSTLGASFHETKTLGEIVTENEQIKTFYSNRLARSGKVLVGDIFRKTAIVTNGDLFAPAQRVPQINAVSMALRVRDLLRVSPATSNAVEFVREKTSGTTNAAAPQGKGSSPRAYENVAKAESAIDFELVSTPIQTIAHWIPASRQVADDSSALSTFLNGRMIYFLKVVEEDQLLNGTGSGGDLDGLVTGATSYDTGDDVVGDTKLDKLRRAINQVQVSGFTPNGIVLNAADWTDIELIKTTGSASLGEYVFSSPRIAGVPSVWGVPVVLSTKMTAGNFLVGDFQNGAELFDRQQASVEISREHESFFVKNMIAVLAELREALVIYQASSMRKGAF